MSVSNRFAHLIKYFASAVNRANDILTGTGRYQDTFIVFSESQRF
jgi:hypothetical protein